MYEYKLLISFQEYFPVRFVFDLPLFFSFYERHRFGVTSSSTATKPHSCRQAEKAAMVALATTTMTEISLTSYSRSNTPGIRSCRLDSDAVFRNCLLLYEKKREKIR